MLCKGRTQSAFILILCSCYKFVVFWLHSAKKKKEKKNGACPSFSKFLYNEVREDIRKILNTFKLQRT